MKRLGSAAAIILALAVPVLSQQDRNTPPVFRSAVDLVQVDAYVTDSQGNPVTGLTADDFEVREDRRPQSIAYFLPFNIPIEERREGALSVTTFAEPDVLDFEVARHERPQQCRLTTPHCLQDHKRSYSS